MCPIVTRGNRSRFDLVNLALGGELRSILRSLRDEGATYDEMVQAFAARGVDLSRETLRRWVRDLDPDDQPKAATA
jgi:hypothetical protein